jgi:hypothetical protein
VSYGAPALIMLLAALGRLFGAALALPRPDALSPLLNRPVFAAHNTRRYEHPLAGGLGPIGGGAMVNFAITGFQEGRRAREEPRR